MGTRLVHFYMELADGDFDHHYERLRLDSASVQVLSDNIQFPSWGGEGFDDMRLVVCYSLAEKWKLDGSKEDSILTQPIFSHFQLSPAQLRLYKGMSVVEAEKLLETAVKSKDEGWYHLGWRAEGL